MQTHRAEINEALSYGGVGALHRDEAKIEDLLRWQLKLIKAFLWHRRRLVFCLFCFAFGWSSLSVSFP